MSEKKILIVDDNTDLVHIMSIHLKSQGYTVISASDLAGAIEAIQTKMPDLIILDIAMPDGDGLSVLRKLNASNPKNMIPVIVMTGMETRAKAAAFKAGAADFFLKPVNINTLLECIREELGQPAETGQASQGH